MIKIDVDADIWDPDLEITLDKLAKIIRKLQNLYGKKAVLNLDAGYNNIGAQIIKEN